MRRCWGWPKQRIADRDLGELVLVGVVDDLGDSGKRGQFFGGALGVASGDDDLRGWIFTVGSADGRTSILIGGGGDGAGIEDNNTRLGNRIGTSEPLLLELVLDSGAVGLGCATTEVVYEETGHRVILAAHWERRGTGGSRPAVDHGGRLR